MKRTRRKINRASDYLRRNVLSYRYIKKNILMTMLVVALSVMVIALVRYGEDADPLADELYQNEEINMQVSEAVMMDSDSIVTVMDTLRSKESQLASYNNRVVAASPSTDTTDNSEAENSSTETDKEDSIKKEGTITADGVRVRAQANTDADVLEITAIGDVYEVNSENSDWVEIVLDDGSTGYVAADYIVVANVITGDMSLDE
ncbi:MAG: SH3 domain-containing protein [Coprococcus sp.]